MGIHAEILKEMKRVKGYVPQEVEKEVLECSWKDFEYLKEVLEQLKAAPDFVPEKKGPVRHQKEPKQRDAGGGMRWHPNNEGIKRRLETDKRHKLSK